jgi:hypothetical protein
MRPLLLLGLGSLLGCISACALSSPALSPGSTGSIEPLEYTLATGTLVATVEGYPRDVQYFVNGVRIDSEEEIRWWKDAEIRLELKPGAYRLSATYVARGFAPDAKQFHIETKEPFQIRAGQETHVRAVILKDWRGVPETDTTYFEVWDPTKQPAASGGAAAAATSAAATAVASESEGAGEGAAATVEPAGSYPAGGVTVIHGTRDGEPEIEQVGEAAAPAESEAITIRGHEVLPPESATTGTSASASTGEPAASPAASTSAPASETPPPAAPQQAEAGGSSPAPQVAPTTATGETSTPAGEAPTTAAGAPSADTVTEKPSTESTSAVGLAAIEVPAQEELPPASTTAPAVAAGASAGSGAHATVMVLLETEPAGAQVTVDDQAAGATPLRVRLDPTVDHVVQFSRDGCSDHVRFLSAAGWEKGRSTTLHVQLECP